MKHIIPILTVAALMAACSNEDVLQTRSDATAFDGKNIQMQVDDYIMDGATRTAISNTGAFTWAKNDKVGVWPTLEPGEEEVASQVMFTAGAGGAQSATFTGSGWGLMPERTYYAYFPYNAGAKPDSVPCKYPTTLTQTANDATSHLGSYDFMYASATAPTEGNVAFQFHHFSSLMKIVVNVPEAYATSKFTKAVISSEAIFPYRASYNPTDAQPVMKAVDFSDVLTLNLNSIVPVDGKITLWFIVGPADLSGNDITVELMNGKCNLAGTVSGANQRAGYGHQYSVDVEKNGIVGIVDLGMPSGTMWGISNLTVDGFGDETIFGDYFAWGCTDVYYTSMTMKADGTMSSGWKSEYSGGYTESNYKKTFSTGYKLKPSEDAATVILGEGWSIPTKAQADELNDNCTATEATVGGVKGALYTSKINGNTIFLPYNGYFSGNAFKGCSSNNPGARMWLNESTSSSKAYQWGYLSQGDHQAVGGKDAYRGSTIRPVYVNPNK